MKDEVEIRAAVSEDTQAILDIYKYYVENTSLTFEYQIPTYDEFRNRIIHTLEHYPYLVAECSGKIIGYAYAGRFHPRAAYEWNVEMTIYLDVNNRRKGIGQKLYTLLENILKEQGILKSIAVITFPKDEYSDFNSMQFHEKMGYNLSGKIDYSGYKFKRWYSVIYMDKMIGVPKENMNHILDFNDVRNKFNL